MNNYVNSEAIVNSRHAMKRLILRILSTKRMIESMPFKTGRSVMKSQDKPEYPKLN